VRYSAAIRLRTSAVFATALCAALAPERARASGFQIDEQDARATGRAGAVIADPRGASSVYYNPAGLAELAGIDVEVGASVVAPSTDFTAAADGSKTKADTQAFVLPQVYAGWRVHDRSAIGVGLNAPFGLALKWPASSPGSAIVREAELRTFFITLAAAYNFGDWAPGLSAGFGVDFVPASVRLTRDIPFGTALGGAALSGDAFGVGGRAGIVYRPPSVPALSFGLTYRSPVQLDFSGNGDFDAPPAYRGSLPPDGKVYTVITLPQTVQLGINVKPVPEWGLEVDGSWRGWSSYDRLDLALPDGRVQSSRKDWKDSLTLRVGTEYTLAERWSGRLGFIWDQTPIPATTLDFQLPDAERIDLTAGLGAQITPGFRADAAVLRVLPRKRNTGSADALEPPVKGRYAIEAWVIGFNLSFQVAR
jgi:long-chain fatty acid transport protein